MPVHPLISALRRHKSAVVLIVLQIALTLAIVSNAAFIVKARIQRVERPTGLDEENLFLVTQQWSGLNDITQQGVMDKMDAMLRADLAVLRGLPGVASVTPVNSLPLLNSGAWNGGIRLTQEQAGANLQATYYFTDESALATLGLKLVAGRNFTPADVQNKAFGAAITSPAVMLTQELARALFPQGDALGKTVYLDDSTTPASIVGIVSRLQTPNGDFDASRTYNSVLVPVRINSSFSRYAVRTRPGQLQAAMRGAAASLYSINAMRFIADDGVEPYADIREQSYRADIGMAVLLLSISLAVLCVTVAGVFGLTSFWVDQRDRQIGVRRALGARRLDILCYFHLENLLIAGAGTMLGVAMALGLNFLLITHYEMHRLPVIYVLLSALAVMLLSQVSTFIPARRATKVDPISAIRSI